MTILNKVHVACLLVILQDYAPDPEAREANEATVRAMYADGMTDRGVVQTLAEYLIDGLKHGNWPWTIERMGRKT